VNEPVNEPVATASVNVKPSTVVAVAPKATDVVPNVTLSFVRAELGMFVKLASTTLIPPPATEIVESAFCTTNLPAEVVKPFPAKDPESIEAVTAVAPLKVPPSKPSPNNTDSST
jgi:hypothetical protein